MPSAPSSPLGTDEGVGVRTRGGATKVLRATQGVAGVATLALGRVVADAQTLHDLP